MSSTKEYVDFVCEQICGTGSLRSKKMFGEYMVYVNEKPLLLVCDNTVFVKKLPEIEGLMAEARLAAPYEGAKEHYILDIEDRELCERVIAVLEPITPLPTKRRR